MKQCKYCGAGYEESFGEIIKFSCGSNVAGNVYQSWVRSIDCYHDENTLLIASCNMALEEIKKMKGYISKLETDFKSVHDDDKLWSYTPRTEAASYFPKKLGQAVCSVKFAERLERELIEACNQIKSLKSKTRRIKFDLKKSK